MDTDKVTVIKDYKDKNVIHEIGGKLARIEHRQNYFESIVRELVQKVDQISTYLEENREKYTKSLENVADKEDNMTALLTETKKILDENRILYGQSFDSVLTGEGQLRRLLEQTKEILGENRAICTQALKDVYEQEIKTRKRIEELIPTILKDNE